MWSLDLLTCTFKSLNSYHKHLTTSLLMAWMNNDQGILWCFSCQWWSTDSLCLFHKEPTRQWFWTVTSSLFHCTAGRKSPCPPAVTAPRGPVPPSLSQHGPCWPPSDALTQSCTHTPPLFSAPSENKLGDTRATEHQLLWCDSGWHRSAETEHIIRFQIPCRKSESNSSSVFSSWGSTDTVTSAAFGLGLDS